MTYITDHQDAAQREQLGLLQLALHDAGIRSLVVGRHSLSLVHGRMRPPQRQSPYLVVYDPEGNLGGRLRVTIDGESGAAFYWVEDRGAVHPVLDAAGAVTAIAAIVNPPGR